MTPVLHVDKLELSVRPFQWIFARERRAEIDTHFAILRERNPAVWNGRVLLMHYHEIAGSVLRGNYFETDFASFVAWRDFGFPDASVLNAFALGALQGSDGGYVMGVMGAQTVNAGRIYFPGGTPDLNDLDGDSVDLERSVRREVEEETGLRAGEFEIDAGWHCIAVGPMIALLKPMRAAVTAEQLRQRIRDHIAGEDKPELADAVIARGASDILPTMPAFIQAFLRNSSAD